jgi:soluble lytic murein transglycosylase-like protein
MFTQGQVQATDVNTVKAAIVKHALELGVDPALALSIARTESGFRYDAKSPSGAIGVFQLMPATAKNMGLNPYYLNDNIKGGLMYYQKLYKIFGSHERALAAYNAGPTYVKRHGGVPPCTKGFVNKIMADYNNQKKNPDQAIVNANKAAEAAKKAVQELAEIPVAEPIQAEAAI